MKKLIAGLLIALMPFLTVNADETYKFSLDKAQCFGLVYGPGVKYGAAIVDDKILYEGSQYWVKDGVIFCKVVVEKKDDKKKKKKGAIEFPAPRIPASEILEVGEISKDGVTLTYRGQELVLKLKEKPAKKAKVEGKKK